MLDENFSALIGAQGLIENLIGGFHAIAPWQDDPERTHAEVLEILDRAIEMAQ